MIQAVSYFILLSISFFKRKSYILYFVCIVFLWLIASLLQGMQMNRFIKAVMTNINYGKITLNICIWRLSKHAMLWD